MFKNMVGIFQGGSLMGVNFPGGSFPDTKEMDAFLWLMKFNFTTKTK